MQIHTILFTFIAASHLVSFWIAFWEYRMQCQKSNDIFGGVLHRRSVAFAIKVFSSILPVRFTHKKNTGFSWSMFIDQPISGFLARNLVKHKFFFVTSKSDTGVYTNTRTYTQTDCDKSQFILLGFPSLYRLSHMKLFNKQNQMVKPIYARTKDRWRCRIFIILFYCWKREEKTKRNTKLFQV